MKRFVLVVALAAIGCGDRFSSGGSGGTQSHAGSGGYSGSGASGNGGSGGAYLGGAWVDCSSGDLVARGIDAPLSSITLEMTTEYVPELGLIPDVARVDDRVLGTGAYEWTDDPPSSIVVVRFPDREELLAPTGVFRSGLKRYDDDGKETDAPVSSCVLTVDDEIVSAWPPNDG